LSFFDIKDFIITEEADLLLAGGLASLLSRISITFRGFVL